MFCITDGQLRLQRPQVFTQQVYLRVACRVGWKMGREWQRGQLANCLGVK